MQGEGIQEGGRQLDDPIRDGLRQGLRRARHGPLVQARESTRRAAASGEQIFPEGGGLQIRDGTGEVIGAVGVTGDTEERDEELAAHGIRSVGLKTDEDCATTVGRRRGIRLTDT